MLTAALNRLIDVAQGSSVVIYNKTFVVPIYMKMYTGNKNTLYCQVCVYTNREVLVQFFHDRILNKIANEGFKIDVSKMGKGFQPFPETAPTLIFYNKPPIDNDLESFTISFLSKAAEFLHNFRTIPENTVKIKNAIQRLHSQLKVNQPILIIVNDLPVVILFDESHIKVISPVGEFQGQHHHISKPPTTGRKGKQFSMLLNKALRSIEFVQKQKFEALVGLKKLKTEELHEKHSFRKRLDRRRDRLRDLLELEDFRLTEARVNAEEKQMQNV